MTIAHAEVDNGELLMWVCNDCLVDEPVIEAHCEETVHGLPKQCIRCKRFLENALNKYGARYVLQCWENAKGLPKKNHPWRHVDTWLRYYKLSELRMQAGERALRAAETVLEETQLKVFLNDARTRS